MGISRKEALDCLRSDDLIGIGMEADAVRRRLHPEGVVSYAIECDIDCAAVMDGGTIEGNHPPSDARTACLTRSPRPSIWAAPACAWSAELARSTPS